MTTRIHCDADGCPDSYDGDQFVEPTAPGWHSVSYISASRTMADDTGAKHFSSLACLARWASESALRQQRDRASSR